jgi:hypothetical protein
MLKLLVSSSFFHLHFLKFFYICFIIFTCCCLRSSFVRSTMTCFILIEIGETFWVDQRHQWFKISWNLLFLWRIYKLLVTLANVSISKWSSLINRYCDFYKLWPKISLLWIFSKSDSNEVVIIL